RLVHGVEQPLPELAVLRSAVRPVVTIRSPRRGLRHATVSLIGSTVTLAGVNAAGVAMTAAPTNARRPGRLPSGVLLDCLRYAGDLDEAIEIASRAAGLAPWSACLSHAGSDR